MIQPHIAIAVAFGIAGLLALPGAMGLKLRMIRLKSAELVLFLAMAAIGIIGYGDKFSPTNDPPRGTSAQLADGNAAPPSRSLPAIATKTHADSSIDIGVGLLAYDLPLAVRPARILPQNYYAYIKDGHALPTLCFDQDEHALVHDMGGVYQTVSGIAPSGKRLEFSEQIIGGYSGNPRFFVVHDDVVVLSTFFYGGNGSGPSVRHYADVVQQFMDQLSSSAGLEASDYMLEEYDFGGYDPCEN